MMNKLPIIYKMIMLKIRKDIDFQEILKGASFSLIARGLALIVGMLINIVVSRYYGAEVMGLLAFINSFLAISLIFSMLGTHVSILRFIPEYIVKFSLSSAYVIYIKMLKLIIFSSFVLFTMITFFSDDISKSIFNKPYLAPFLTLAATFIVVQSLITINTRALRALKSMKLFALFQFLPSAINLIILFIMTFTIFNLYNPIYSQFISYLIVMVLLLYIVNKMFKKGENVSVDTKNSSNYKNILDVSFPMFLSSGMTIVIAQTDTMMLAAMVSDKEVGIYTIASRLALITTFIFTAINTISAPKFAELFHAKKKDVLRKVASKSSKFILLSTLPISISLIVFGKYFLSLFGSEFVDGYSTLVFLSIGQLFAASTGLVGTFLNMTGYEKVLRNIVLLGGTLNILLNLFLIPEYGIEGAAIASMISIMIWNLLALIFIYKKFEFILAYIPFLNLLNSSKESG